VSEWLLPCLYHLESDLLDDFFESLTRLELEEFVKLLPPYHALHVLPLDPALHCEVHVPHLELGGITNPEEEG
jgi:hypothetical protein